MTYTRQANDTAYRLVNLNAMAEPEYISFRDETVFVPPGHVIEVKRGNEEVVIPLPPNEVKLYYYSTDKERVVLSKEVSLARLWLYSTENPDILYKVPTTLPDASDSDRYRYFIVPGGTANISLRGDKYFDAAYRLSRP